MTEDHIKIWSLKKREYILNLKYADYVYDIIVNKNVIAIHIQNSLEIRDLTGTLINTFHQIDDLREVHFSLIDNEILFIDGGTLMCYDYITGALKSSIFISDTIFSSHLLPNGNLVFHTEDHILRVVDATKIINTFQREFREIIFLSNGQLALIVDDGDIHIVS